MNRLLSLVFGLLALALWPSLTQAAPVHHVQEYNLTIARQMVEVAGKPRSRITVNGTSPGPVLRFTDGDDAIIHVTNTMSEDSSIHWHGLLVPASQDGVPGFNGFDGIRPGQTFTYHFHIKQSGTYWYHAHSMGQEQDGLFGAIVIAPAPGSQDAAEDVKSDRDYTVVLSDESLEPARSIEAHLKMSSDYYAYHRRTLGDFFSEVGKMGLGKALKKAGQWGRMNMSPNDLADVEGYIFIVNGESPTQNWTGLFKPGEKVRLRFINAASMTMYDVRIPGLKMTVVAADGQPVEPVSIDEFRIGNAETYDVIVEPKDDKAYTIAAEPIDRTGFAIGTLAPRDGMKGDMPAQRPRSILTMSDMNMSMMMMEDPKMDMSAMDGPSGWADAHAPEGTKILSYNDLIYRDTQGDTREPTREITVHLDGNMERYVWTINGKTFDPNVGIHVAYNERVRLILVNDSMMAHPMHLHGMFVQLENGQPMDKLPNKHTVIVPPGQTVSVILTADNEGTWAFHCHLMYHMLSGMMTDLVVEKPGAPPPASMPSATGDMKGMSGMSGMDMGKSPTSGTSGDMKGMDMSQSASPSAPLTKPNDMSGMQMPTPDAKAAEPSGATGSAMPGMDMGANDQGPPPGPPMVMTAPDAKPTTSTPDAMNGMAGMDMSKKPAAKAPPPKKKVAAVKKKGAPEPKPAPMKMDGMNMGGMNIGGMDMSGSVTTSKEASHAH
ncbi:multicopper oxidase domain-containing protein [Asticcacaulis sp. EMRT-3]|uniref:multicopper oxidase domain-containing protein n=1 Tax=Asticcacaulis sp. EMRT-3 TaxID=3040349 RepID=UPI0024AFFD12|nr:multicopper oxidase domain-containing protein [Asticcacaulis sp. EMRT-3]MDI7774773.1 multicopper oxidase domain-containing protein [Asticcacaulis sp. EMRT-3]